jgi:hypothetical protein
MSKQCCIIVNLGTQSLAISSKGRGKADSFINIKDCLHNLLARFHFRFIISTTPCPLHGFFPVVKLERVFCVYIINYFSLHSASLCISLTSPPHLHQKERVSFLTKPIIYKPPHLSKESSSTTERENTNSTPSIIHFVKDFLHLAYMYALDS